MKRVPEGRATAGMWEAARARRERGTAIAMDDEEYRRRLLAWTVTRDGAPPERNDFREHETAFDRRDR